MEENNIKMGRDKFINLMVEHGYHVQRRRRAKLTTNSNHKYLTYENKLKDLFVSSADQVWISDITYLRTREGFLYLSLVSDMYSRKILGYHVSESLKTSETLKALKMSIKTSNRRGSTIHHSDRGIQYLSPDYVEYLKKHGIESSTTKGGSPQENAVAERINGILKHEYGISDKHISRSQCRQLVDQAIELYNKMRPHLSLQMRTPDNAYESYYSNQHYTN